MERDAGWKVVDLRRCACGAGLGELDLQRCAGGAGLGELDLRRWAGGRPLSEIEEFTARAADARGFCVTAIRRTPPESAPTALFCTDTWGFDWMTRP
jgi:hypothetical protein